MSQSYSFFHNVVSSSWILPVALPLAGRYNNETNTKTSSPPHRQTKTLPYRDQCKKDDITMRISKISKLIFLLPLCLLAYGGGGCTFCSAFAPIVIPQRKLFSSSSSYLPAEKSKNKLLPGLETLQTKASEFAASSLNELSGGSNKLATTTRPPLKASPPAPFDPTNPEALIAITKSFIATDFGIQSSQVRIDEIFCLVSSNFHI